MPGIESRQFEYLASVNASRPVIVICAVARMVQGFAKSEPDKRVP